MERDLPRLESSIKELSSRLDELAARVADLERRLEADAAEARPQERGQEVPSADEPPAGEVAGVEPTSRRPPTAGTIPLLGRTLVVLGGAFLLRAITDAGVLPQAAGIALGLIYAGLWIVWSNRTAAKGRRASATFHGLAATVIAYPLLIEATIKFKTLSPAVSAAVVLGMTAFGLGITGRRGLRFLSWTITLAASVTALVLAFSTRSWGPFFSFLTLLGLGTLWMGYLRKWAFLGWLNAFGLDLAMLLITALYLDNPRPELLQNLNATVLILLLLGFALGYLGSVAVRTLIRGRNVLVVEIFQSIIAIAVGFGGAVFVAQSSMASSLPLGLMSGILSVGFYSVSFAFIDRRLGRGRNFLFYTSLALVFTLAAVFILLSGPGRDVALAAAALLTLWLGTWRERATLSLHGAVYVLTAAIASGLFSTIARVFAGGNIEPARLMTFSNMIIIMVAGLGSWFTVVSRGSPWGRLERVPKLVSIVIFVAGLDAIIVSLVGSLVFGEMDETRDGAALAALRMGVLALTVVALAWVGRWPRLYEALWLVYPLLMAMALKLLLEDLRFGRSVTIFVTLAVYGGALILAPRLARLSRMRQRAQPET